MVVTCTDSFRVIRDLGKMSTPNIIQISKKGRETLKACFSSTAQVQDADQPDDAATAAERHRYPDHHL